LNSIASTGTFIIPNSLLPIAKFKYYRVIGVAGKSYYGGIKESRFVLATSFVQSQFTKATCLTGRDDADLIPNHLDLDSDGDGCSDALEAGTSTSTTANFKFIGGASDFGVNGFYNTLEKTAAESNLYKGIYTYHYATDDLYNACTDTDTDGVPDLMDIDDDNDGILDAVESPTCFYTNVELSQPSSISSELLPYSTYLLNNAIDGNAATASGFTEGQNWVDKEIFKFTAKNYIAISGMSFDLVSWALSSSGSTFKLQGSGDNVTWVDLSTPTTSTTSSGTITISNTLALTSKFKYFRLLGVAGVCGYGGVTEARFNIATSTIASANPKLNCVNDTDGDGILNHNDLDSDGDSCPDAIEAGTSPLGTTASTATSFLNPTTTGANGFANNLETGTESGIFSGTYSYNFAISSTLNGCTDTDGDGITDLKDIDDDNDGVLDTKECDGSLLIDQATSNLNKIAKKSWTYLPAVDESVNPLYAGTYFGHLREESNNLVYGELILPSADLSTSAGATIDNITSLNFAAADNGSIVYRELLVKIPATTAFQTANQLSFRINNPTTAWSTSYLYLAHQGASILNTAPIQGGGGNTSTLLNYNSQDFKLVSQSKYNTPAYTTGGEFIVSASNAGKWVRMGILIMDGQANEAVIVEYKLGTAGTWTTVDATNGFQFSSNGFNDLVNNTYIDNGCDKDGDGIPNRLDLDSDGDGCSDALESGTSTNTTANYKFTGSPADFGANGFFNTLEKTNAESNLYKGSYTYYYAIDNTQNACLDSDTDGIKDIIDLDDDNDGVLDYVEQSCEGSVMNKSDITVSSEIAWTFQNTLIGLPALFDGSLLQQMYPTATTVINNKTIFQFNFTAPKVLNLIELANISGQIPFAAGGTYKIQGSNDDGTTWSDIVSTQVVANSSPILATTNSIKFNMPANYRSFLSYRIFAISMTGQGNWSTEAYFREITCEDINTDGDAKPNRLDLDSDGDACPDAVEAGTTYISTSGISGAARVTTSVIPAPYGANGFANGLETSTESGAYTGTYSYVYAADATLSACADTDGDGVTDVLDLDDDNDGVLDTVECSTASPNILVNGTFDTNTTGWTASANWVYYAPGFLWNSAENVTNDKISQIFEKPVISADVTTVDVVFDFNTNGYGWDITSPNTASLDVILNNTTYATLSNPSGGTTASVVAKNGATVNVSTVDIVSNNVPTTKIIVKIPKTALATTNTLSFSFTASSDDIGIDNVFIGTQLDACDNDGDGIINSKDLDSDGDGCPDAVEAGTTYISTSGITGLARLSTNKIPGPYDANGFANGVETSSGSGIYKGTYTYDYAVNSLINACTDSDGDGVSDVLDLDDDNDGVLDSVENNCVVATLDKTGAIITKPSTIGYSFNSNAIANLIDGVDNNVYVVSAPTGTLNGPWFNFEFPSPKVLTYLEIGHYQNQLLFSTTSTYKIQGSTDNANWIDVTGTLTYNNVATSTSGGLSNFNSNIANFPANTKAYKFYRVLGINASTGGGWATEIHFKEFVCSALDFDGDGIPNRLDLDSDGDGCPDAVEAGTTGISSSGVLAAAKLTTSVIPAPYGANGFANGLETTTTESGAYTGTYTYNYALDATLNACKDSDNDGVPDITDLDDDNDGVLDRSEQLSCVTSGIDLTTLTFNGSAITSKTSNSITTPAPGGWISSYSNQNLKLPISLKFNYASTNAWVMFGLQPITKAQTPSSWDDGAYKFYPVATSTYGYFTSSYNDIGPIAITQNDVLSIDISATGYVTAAINGVTKKAYQGVVSDYKLSISAYAASSLLTNIILSDATNPVKTVCTDLDTDGDGIPNRLDLDSDGDDCPDAVEAGTTAISTSGVASTAKYSTSVIPAPYGNNGFANGLETTIESGAYTGTYAYSFAIDASFNGCKDTDGDGVPDVLDLDDDNDGILDTVECPSSISEVFPTTGGNTNTLPGWTVAGTYSAAPWTSGTGVVNLNTNGLEFRRDYSTTTTATKAFANVTPNSKLTIKDIYWYNTATAGATTVGILKIKLDGVVYATINTGQLATSAPTITLSNGATSSLATLPATNAGTTSTKSTIVLNLPNAYLASGAVQFEFVASTSTGDVDDIGLSGISISTNCDADNDGIPNSLDLDSDGDGCPDAKESGVTGTLNSGSVKNGSGGLVTSTSTIANAIAAGPYGNNGLANGVETATESGVVTYTSTYAANALVKDLVAPTVSTQPLNKTVFVGSAIVLTTTAGTAPANRTLTYQWYKAGVAITGATSATYTVTSSATTANVDDYYCAVGFVNSCLTTNTNTINVTVLTNPVGLTACQDANAPLSVTKTGTNSVTYQWKKAGVSLVNGAKIAGATTTSLTLTNLALADAGAYTLVATDANNVAITSLAGTITITNNTKYVLPTSYATCATTSTINLSSSVFTSTSGATSTKWQRSIDGGNIWTDITSSIDAGVTYTNFTTATLGITTATTTASATLNGYQYRIATSNATCTNYSTVETLTINAAPTITTQPSSSVLCTTYATSFTAVATGSNILYQWQTRPAGSGSWTNITGSNASSLDAGVVYSNYTTATLNLSASPAAENNNQYQLVVSNSCGTVTSTTAVLNPTVATPTISGGNVSVCEGNPVSLTASSSTASPTYQWYLAGSAIGGATNAAYNPTASGNYSVIANATGYCSSGTASATVTINPLPTVTIAQGAVLTLTSGGGIDLTATASPTATYSYTWYNNTTSVSGPSSSNVYTVAGAGSYTVKATNTITNCFATSAATIITVLPSPSVNGSSSICSGGSVAMSFALATGQSIQWESSLNGTTWTPINSATNANYNATPTNSTNATITIYYHAVISGASPTGTTNAIVVTVNPLPTATISNSASGITLCAGTEAILTSSSGASSATYQWYNNNSIITGATASTYTATGSGIYSFNVTDGATSCAASSITSTVTVVSPPAAPNLTATSKIICVNTTADLTVYQPIALTGISYEWHSAANTLSSTLVANPAAVATAGTYYLFAKNNSAACYSTPSVGFILSIQSVGSVSLTSASTPTYTVGDITVALNASTANPTYSLRWYSSLTGGVALTSPVLPSSLYAGTTNYYVEQYDGNESFCTSNPRQLAVVTVKPLAPAVTNITYCQNATAVALTATPAIGGTLNWYGTSASSGTLTATATIPATGTATNTTYYVSQTVNGVEGARAALTVSINAAPNSPSVITGTFSVISTNSYTYSVTSAANTTYQWTLPSFMSGSSTTNSITALVNAAGTGTIHVVAVNANGCSSPASTSSIISAAQFVAPPPTITNSAYTIVDPAIPSNTSSQVTAASGATLNYYTSNAAGTTSTSAQSMPTTEGVYTYYVSQTINGVESVLVPYTVTIKPVQPTVTDITYCQNEVAAQLTATGTALKWYTVSTGGASSSTATPSTGTATNTTYYVTQTINGAESDRTALLVTINPTPATPGAITGSTTTSTNLSELYSVTNDVTATSYVWTIPSGWSGNSSVNDITASAGLSGGQISVKALNGDCASPAAIITVTILNVTNPPLTTDITFVTGSTPSNILTNTTALITGAASSTLNFYTSNAAGTASTTTQPTPTEPGVYTYYVSQTSSIGVESILVPYTITVKPTAPAINTNTGIVGNTINYCKGATPSPLTATVTDGGVLNWYTVSTGGFPSSIIPTVFTSVVGTTNYYVSQIVNGVESDRALIVVKVNDLPSAISATASQPTCSITSGTILVTSPLGAGFTYSVDGSSYTATTLFNTLPSGSYLVTAKNGNGCISNPTTVTINPAVIPPLTPLTSEVQPTCSVRTGTINIISTGLSSDSYSIDGGLSYQSSKIFTNVAPGTYSVTTQNASGCVSGATTAVINAAPPIPSQPIISSIPSGVICEGTSVTMTSSVSSGNQWYKDGVLIAGAIDQTYLPNVSGNYSVIVTNASGCISLESAAENITFNNLPTPIIAGGATLAFNNCTTTTITLSASNTSAASGNTYQWYLNGNSINVAGTGATYNANQAGNYSVVITNNGCSATSSISKLISAPSVNAANTAFCAGGNSIISGVNTGFVNPVYQWQISSDNGLTWANASGVSTNLNYTSTQSGKYQLQVTDGGLTSTSCPVIVTVFTNPTASITVNPSTAVCAGSTIGLAANTTSGTAPYTYQWSLASSNDIANATASSYATGIAGSYEVKVTDANGCTVIAAPSTIDFNTVPTAPTVVITNPTCSVTTGTISITAPLGAGFTYSIDGVNYTNTTGLFTGVAPGAAYNVTAKSTSGCISSATSATIAAALVLPAQPGVISGPTSVAANSLNTYSVSPVAGATSYTWTIPGVWTGVSITNAITIKVDASSGSISVSANSATCSGPARSLAITAISTVPDVNVTNINVPVTGSLTTNDLVPAGSTYGQPGNNPANPTGATITVNADGSYTFTSTTPGKYIYYVPVCAPGQSSNCPLTPLAITVLDPSASDNKPVVNYDIVIAPVNTATTVNILSNDKAGNNGISLNPSSVTAPVQPAHGRVVVNADGTLTYTPFNNYVGTDSVIYSVCDNSPTPICQTSVVYFTISPVAVDKTLAADDFASVGGSLNGTTATGNVLTNDKNTAGASLTASLVTGPSASQGTLVFNTDGSYVFTPAQGFSGPVDIVYTACTGATPPVCATATLHILVDVITADIDGDGVLDNLDLDNDNDGILDSVEFAACTPSSSSCDTDGDGIPNNLDLDSDGDGINDAIESGGIDVDGDGKVDGGVDASGVPLSANGGLSPADADGDGKKNPYDVDSDGDGIPDSVEKGTGATPVDTDGDGVPDYLDTDSDGDGIPDSIEKGTGSTPVDTDGDGVPDYRDLDSDGDGILDSIEKGPGATPVDTDGDGVPDYKDLDSDNDGILDSIEKGSGSTPVDTDGDGVPDYKDLDSDNDGIPDSIEKGTGATPVDTDGDGVPDYKDLDSDNDGIPDSIEKGSGATPVDTDGDGIPDYQDLDSDNDGIPDNIEKGSGATPVDTDGDGVPDYKDLDSDNDGIPDSIEKGSGATPVDTDGDGVPDYKDLDSDNDGIPDSIEKGSGATPVDTDGDGVPDYKDLDSDNDGILDSIEKGSGATPVDTDGDGVPDYQDLDSDNDGILDSIEKGTGATPVDTDGDGVPDYQDLDSDNDGILDSIEKGSGSTPVDTDGDGVPDYKDLDSDNDGILDSIEKGSGATPVDTDGDGVPDYKDLDSDNDGILDSIEKGSGATPVDTDGDGVPDYKDLDSDNDGILDSIEKGPGSTPVDTDGDGVPDYLDLDSDNDGIPDSIEKGSGSTPVDTDGDGVPDYKDLDSDNDGILDSIEKGSGATPVDTDGDGVPDYKDLDSDNDGILDSIEKGADGNKPVDTDGDGVPDYLDLDSDNDGIPDSIEKGAGSTPVDTDGDGVLDFQDLDSDNDGILDSIEKGSGSTPVDTDGDGVPDYKDLDSDNDGILDSIEKGSGSTPVDTDGDGVPDYQDLDSDNDGIPDSIEKGSGSTPVDTDGDGIPDYLDLDSDNDGILDSIEKGADGNKPVDTDGDGVPDYKDLDSDNDGIPDSIEKGADGNKPVDTDGDGVPDYRDLDSDNDGIPDSIEKGSNGNKPVDTDGDGITDYLDLDSDNDGIPDSIEKGSDGNKPVDTDGDGVPDYRDLDSDNDGIPDSIEKGADGNKPVDTDGDGIPDYRDLDSDNDGIPDSVEKGADGNKPVDTDGDGVPDYRDLDSDNDGILDSIEKGADGNKPVDTDGDGVPDYRDLDSDGDGVTDADEKRDGTNPIDPCSLKLQSQTMQPSDAWMKADCNGDKVPNGEVLIVTKYVSKPIVQTDGSMQIKYTVALRNPRPDSVKTITIKDDLTKVFLNPINFTVTGTQSTGSLIKTSTYDGRGAIDLVTNLSSIAGYGADSVMIEVTIIPNGFSGDIDNIADVEATTKWGAVKRQSIDTVRSAGRFTGSGVANRFTIPKEKIIIPEAFSPNGDGFNDYFEIIHPSSTTISLAIYNRWGNVVYMNADYQNDWRGNGKGNFLGQELPEGTYYYIINATEKFTKKVSNFAGFLNLKR
jgi:gliding motility-associated-like protein